MWKSSLPVLICLAAGAFTLPPRLLGPARPLGFCWDAPTDCNVTGYILRYGKTMDVLSDYQVLGLVTNALAPAGAGPWFSLQAVGTNNDLSDAAWLQWPTNYSTVRLGFVAWRVRAGLATEWKTNEVLVLCVTNAAENAFGQVLGWRIAVTNFPE